MWAGTFWVADGIFFFPSYLIGWRTCNKWLKLHVEKITYYTANFWCWLNWIVTGIKQKRNTTLFKIRNWENLVLLKIPASGQFIKSFRVWQISKGPLLLCSLKIIQKFKVLINPWCSHLWYTSCFTPVNSFDFKADYLFIIWPTLGVESTPQHSSSVTVVLYVNWW